MTSTTIACAQGVVGNRERARHIEGFEYTFSTLSKNQESYLRTSLAERFPIPAEYQNFLDENEDILNYNIGLLASGRKISRKSVTDVLTEMCRLGPLGQPIAVLQALAVHLERLADGRSNVPDIAFRQFTEEDCEGGRARSQGQRVVFSVPEAEALLQDALSIRFPKIKVDPVVSYLAEIEGALVDVEELPHDVPIFVKLLFEMDEPEPGARLVDVTIGSDTITLEAVQVGPSEFRTYIPFEIVEPTQEVAP